MYSEEQMRVDPGELIFEYFHASGPGGQHINKTATAVRLRFNLRRSDSLPPDVKARLAHLAGRKVTGDGILLIEARRYRSRERNQLDAVERLNRLIARAWEPPRPRKPGRPTRGSVERRLEEKRHRSLKKESRRLVNDD